MSDFRDLVDTEGLDPEEEARLRRVHELLVQAGPPPDLPPALERTPEAAEAEIVQFPLLPRRRWAAAASSPRRSRFAFGGGYLFGHSKGEPQAFKVKHVVTMHGPGSERAGDRRRRRHGLRRQLADGDPGERPARSRLSARRTTSCG